MAPEWNAEAAKMKTRIFQILNWVCRIVLAVMFIYTGYIKLPPDPFSFGSLFNIFDINMQFAVVLTGYELFPDALIPFIAKWFPWAEIVLGIFLLIGWKMRYVAAAATALLLSFTIVLCITYFRGIDANCGCFDFNTKITPLTILRDGIILIPALYLLFENKIRRIWKTGKSA
jgi:uncharacterized membrane protein YphA (DoxX/SURF4 family)